MENKYELLLNYSDPRRVKILAKQFLGDDVPLYVSTRKNKKYMIRDPNGKMIHFGEMGYEDFSKHMDLDRRKSFVSRNAKWAKQDKYTAGWLSYNLLWT